MFTHQKLHVYQKSLEMLTNVRSLLHQLPAGNADIANQLRRASFSVPLNIAEGAGRNSLVDKRRFYAIARGSALECAAILDVCQRFELCENTLRRGINQQLEEIVAMLSALVFR